MEIPDRSEIDWHRVAMVTNIVVAGVVAIIGLPLLIVMLMWLFAGYHP